jgi:hypothetical protein
MTRAPALQGWEYFGVSTRGLIVDGQVYALLWWQPSEAAEGVGGEVHRMKAWWVLSFLEDPRESGTLTAPPPPHPLTGDTSNEREMAAFRAAEVVAEAIARRRLAGERHPGIWQSND